LQFEFYLTRALEEAHKVGQKPVEADIIDNVLAKDINGLEPRLTREGYNTKVLAELLNAKPREIRVLPTVVSPGAIWAEVEPGFHIGVTARNGK